MNRTCQTSHTTLNRSWVQRVVARSSFLVWLYKLSNWCLVNEVLRRKSSESNAKRRGFRGHTTHSYAQKPLGPKPPSPEKVPVPSLSAKQQHTIHCPFLPVSVIVVPGEWGNIYISTIK